MGPTAAGKTAASLALAQALHGEIVSVDSALVYRGMEIGSAKPSAEERRQVAHHLLDLCAPNEPYSAADFAVAATSVVNAIVERGRLPLLVGGTGLYFRALLEGLADMPEADAELRCRLSEQAERLGWPALHRQLAAVDPVAAARIRPQDAQRIMRALEVWQLSGRPITQWQQAGRRTAPPWRVLKLVLAPTDRGLLHERIEQRFRAMLEHGLIEEVQQLRRLPGVHAELPSMRAVGYRQTWAFLDGELDRTELERQGIAATRQLAKRQLTWLRREFDAFWVDPTRQPGDIIRRCREFL